MKVGWHTKQVANLYRFGELQEAVHHTGLTHCIVLGNF